MRDESRNATVQILGDIDRHERSIKEGEQTDSAWNPPLIESSYSLTKHQLTVSGKSSVGLVSDSEVVPSLTER
jgi:hypothetical protein